MLLHYVPPQKNFPDAYPLSREVCSQVKQNLIFSPVVQGRLAEGFGICGAAMLHG